MTERPVNFDARDIGGRMGSSLGGQRGQQQEPNARDTQRFQMALQAGPSPASTDSLAPPDSLAPSGSLAAPRSLASTGHRGASQAAGEHTLSQPAQPYDSPLAPSPLAGMMSPASAAAFGPEPSRDRLESLRQELSRLVGRLMVGDGSNSPGGRSLIMDLNDERLPGVTVAVFEDAGAWVAEFRCTQAEPYVLLAEPAQAMASRLADSLAADSVWRVVADGLNPDGAWQRLVNNDLNGLPCTEAFASCTHARR